MSSAPSILSCIARFFQRPAYTSEITHAIEEMKDADPQLEQRQLAGRARLWDTEQDRRARAQYRQARVEQGAYVYQTGSDYPAPTPSDDLL